MFDILSSKKIFHANNIQIYENRIKGSLPYVVRTTQNNGIRGYIIEDIKYANDKNTLSFAQDTFSVFYQKENYFTGNKVKVLKPKFPKTNELIMKYITASMQKALSRLSWGVGSTVESISNTKISLPIKNGNIDFDFMEEFMKELENSKLKKVKEYLKENNLDNATLTTAEKEALEKFENNQIEWGEFRIGDLFEKIKVNKLSYKANDLPVEKKDDYILPALTSSFKNQGLNYFVPEQEATILKNVISIPSNSDVYRAYYQSRKFTILSDAYAIKWKDDKLKISSQHYLFMVVAINKVTDLKIYSYKNKLGGWNIVKDKYIKLPIKNEKIDFDFMENFIKAVEKMIVKNLIQSLKL